MYVKPTEMNRQIYRNTSTDPNPILNPYIIDLIDTVRATSIAQLLEDRLTYGFNHAKSTHDANNVLEQST